MRLFCLPYAGAGENVYFAWRSHLPPWLELRPVALPGRGRRIAEDPVTDAQRLADQLHAELAPELTGSFALFGHSMGALLAYELAHRLYARGGSQPLALIVSGGVAPGRRVPDPAWLGSDQALLDTVARLGGAAPEILADPEWRALLLRVLRADFQLCANYRRIPRTPLDCPLYVCAGINDPATADRVALQAWREETRDKTEILMFEGDHFFIRPQQSALLQSLASRLATLSPKAVSPLQALP